MVLIAPAARGDRPHRSPGLRSSMLSITVNGEPRQVPPNQSVAELLDQLHYDRRRVAVEVNRVLVTAAEHPERRLAAGDQIEIVTLVGGGSGVPADKPLVIG